MTLQQLLQPNLVSVAEAVVVWAFLLGLHHGSRR